MPGEVTVERIAAPAARSHWEAAEHSSVFTHPDVLAAMADDVHWWLASKAGRPACLWPVCLDRKGDTVRPEFCYYVGPVDLARPDMAPRRRLQRSVVIQQAMLGVLTKAYDRLFWSTLPGHRDLRAWQWFGSEHRPVTVVVRHTAVLHGLATMADRDLLSRFNADRRRHARRGPSQGLVILPDISAERVQDLYLQTLSANGAGDLARRRLAAVASLCRLAGAGLGYTVACAQGDDPVARAVWLVVVAKGRACEVLAASDADWRRRNLNAFGRFHSILRARDRGVGCYDFNGANSPNRAADKHCYGAEAELYFDLMT